VCLTLEIECLVEHSPSAMAISAFSEEDLARDWGDGTRLVLPVDRENYGKPITEWKKLIRSRYPAKHMEIVNWLKAEHGMGHGHANALVGHTLGETPNRRLPALAVTDLRAPWRFDFETGQTQSAGRWLAV